MKGFPSNFGRVSAFATGRILGEPALLIGQVIHVGEDTLLCTSLMRPKLPAPHLRTRMVRGKRSKSGRPQSGEIVRGTETILQHASRSIHSERL